MRYRDTEIGARIHGHISIAGILFAEILQMAMVFTDHFWIDGTDLCTPLHPFFHG